MREKIKGIVKDVESMSSDTNRIYLDLEKSIDYKVGQYVIINVQKEEKDGWLRRAYSIASLPEEDGISLCLNKVEGGSMSPILYDLEEGDEVFVEGPMGNFTLNEGGTDKDKFFICTGTGISALRPMLLTALKQGLGEHIYLFFGEKHEGELLFEDEMKSLNEKVDRFTYVPVLSQARDTWGGKEGYVQEKIEEFIGEKDKEDYEFYICGLREMVQETINVLEDIGIEKDNIFYERYT